MLFANIALMHAALAHLVGPQMGDNGLAILLFYTLFLLTPLARDYLVEKQVRPVTVAIAIGMWLSLPIEALLLAPSATWYRFVVWLSK